MYIINVVFHAIKMFKSAILLNNYNSHQLFSHKGNALVGLSVVI